jgi:hypothetical protein
MSGVPTRRARKVRSSAFARSQRSIRAGLHGFLVVETWTPSLILILSAKTSR